MLENIVDGINKFFMYYMIVYAILFFISTVTSMISLNEISLRKKMNNDVRIKNLYNYVPISVIIPAYNEEKTIVSCVQSVLALDYEDYEIIIVNDGSKDKTEEVLIKAFNLKRVSRPIRKVLKTENDISIYEGNNKVKITLVNKENGGKADALNMGVNISKYDHVSCIDADSCLQNDSLKNIVFPFIENDQMVAVGGNIKISNNVSIENGKVKKVFNVRKMIIIFQMIEYYRIFLTTRVWMNSFNGNLIISGAFGVFKKQAILNVGGYTSKSIGEDMELVVKLHSFYRKNEIPYKIGYAPDAICWSQAPEKYLELKSQRKRWHIGLIDSLMAHKYIFLNMSYGIVGVFSFLYFFIFEMFSCFIEVLGLIFIFISYKYGFINLDFLISFLIIYMLFSSIVSVAAIYLEGHIFGKKVLPFKNKVKLIFFSFIEPLFFRQFCSLCRILAVFRLKKDKKEWGYITRIENK